MSYDIALYVKVEDTDIYAKVAEPEFAKPTYNLGEMFRACMDWDFKQSERMESGEYKTCCYPCEFVLDKAERGIRELRTNTKAYEKYNPSNGWGDITSAIRVLESLRECILETSGRIPIKYLYMAW